MLACVGEVTLTEPTSESESGSGGVTTTSAMKSNHIHLNFAGLVEECGNSEVLSGALSLRIPPGHVVKLPIPLFKEYRMSDNMSVTIDPVEAQKQARHDFEREWAVHVGFDLPRHVGDAWWPLTKLPDEKGMTLSEWRRIGEEKGWITIS